MSRSEASSQSPSLTIIVARARNGAIGKDGALPWRLPSDLKHFKAATWGKPLIMGRKTFQSLGRPLPGREIIVLTRKTVVSSPGVFVACDIDEALALARMRAAAMGAREAIVAGGGDVYAAFLPLANRAIVSQIDLDIEGDAWFAPLDPEAWRLLDRLSPEKGPNDEANFIIETHEKR